MLRLALLCVAAAGCLAAPFSAELDLHWENFKREFGKQYDETADVVRRVAWERNVAAIQRHNLDADLGAHAFRLGINQYSDMIDGESAGLRGLKMSQKPRNGSLFLAPSNVHIPDAVDWRTQGYVTPVKNQGACGSCWAFSATGALEGQHMRKSGKLVSLSEQNLVDCSGDWGNNGCEGGLMDQAFQYIKDNKGVDTELAYPYTAHDDSCVFKPTDVGATDTGFVDVESGDEDALMKAVATVGPVSVGIDASHFSFQLYQWGVYSEPDCDPENLDHGVLVVGYGTDEDNQDYWLIKNSWGKSWGEHGYMKMARNAGNMCGVATAASFPLV